MQKNASDIFNHISVSKRNNAPSIKSSSTNMGISIDTSDNGPKTISSPKYASPVQFSPNDFNLKAATMGREISHYKKVSLADIYSLNVKKLSLADIYSTSKSKISLQDENLWITSKSKFSLADNKALTTEEEFGSTSFALGKVKQQSPDSSATNGVSKSTGLHNANPQSDVQVLFRPHSTSTNTTSYHNHRPILPPDNLNPRVRDYNTTDINEIVHIGAWDKVLILFK